MKKTIVVILILALVLVGAWFGYRYFTQKPQAVPAPEQTETQQAPQTEEQPSAEEQTPAEEEKPAEEPAEAQPQTAEGETAPDFTMYTVDGEAVQLSDYFGKPVILNFWATWCPPCKAEMPLLQTAYEQFGQEITFLMVNLTDGTRDTPEAVASFIEENGYTFPVFCDSDYASGSLYNVRYIPTTFLLDASGHILKEHTGQLDEQTLNEYIELLSEQAVLSFLQLTP